MDPVRRMTLDLNMTEGAINNNNLLTDVKRMESATLHHNRLPSCTDFLFNVDETDIHGKRIDCVIGTVHRKPTPVRK